MYFTVAFNITLVGPGPHNNFILNLYFSSLDLDLILSLHFFLTMANSSQHCMASYFSKTSILRCCNTNAFVWMILQIEIVFFFTSWFYFWENWMQLVLYCDCIGIKKCCLYGEIPKHFKLNKREEREREEREREREIK